MENTMTYEELYRKMLSDEEFLAKTKECGSFHDLYNLYCEYGYTDLEYEQFKTAFKACVKDIEENCSKYELTEDELAVVVGGGFWSWAKKAVNFVPVVGPLITTTVDVCTGDLKGAGNIAARYGIAVASGLFDAATIIATGGASIGAQVLIRGGMGALKGAGNIAVDLATSS